MKDYNAIITDTELRDMLRGRLMTHTDEDPFTQKILDMELNTAFNGGLVFAPALQKEREIISRLNSKFGMKAGLKWLWTGLGSVTLVSSLIIAQNHYGKKEKNIAMPLTQASISEKPVAPRQPETSSEYNLSPLAVDSPNLQNKTDLNNTLSSPEAPDNGLDLYKDAPFVPVPEENNSGGPMDVKGVPSKGEIGNHSTEKNKISIDTLFKGIKKLEVIGLYFNINVTAVPGDDVTLKGEMTYEMRGLYVRKADYKIHYERNGSELKIWIENEGKNNTLIMGSMLFEGSFNFNVPEQTEVSLKNMSGDISASGLSGNECRLETNYGNIKAENMNNRIIAKSVSGEITMKNITGGINANASYGNISFNKITGDIKSNCTSGNVTAMQIEGDVEITSQYGNINVQKMNGNLTIFTASGDVNADEIKGETIAIKATYGHIKASHFRAETRITSQSGDVVMDKLIGNLIVKTLYGGQNLSAVKGDINASSTSGNINISLSSGTLDITVIYGNVNLNDCNGKMSLIVQSGDINGKNIDLVESLIMRTLYGNIRMQVKNNINDLSFDLSSISGQIKIEKDGVKESKENGNIVLNKGNIKIKGVAQSGDLLVN